MKKYVFILGLAISMLFMYGYTNHKISYNRNTQNGILFENSSWQEILSKAKKEKKIIFLNLSASWCWYCKKMDKHTYSSPEVATFYNQNFINASFDVEKGEGINLAKKFHVKSLPNLLFINTNGEIIYKTEGYQKPKQMLEIGKKALNKSKN